MNQSTTSKILTCTIALLLLTVFLLSAGHASAQQGSLTNDSAGDGHWSVSPQSGGGTREAYLDPAGAPARQEVIFDYFHYVDPGADGGALELAATTISQPITPTDTHRASSQGQFQGQNGLVNWTATSTLPTGSASYFVRIDFQSAQPFGALRFIQYLDEDIGGPSDDLLVVVGTPGAADFQLLTVDGSNAVGVAHGAFYLQGTNITFAGWAADRFSNLRGAIQGSGAAFTIPGSINTANLPPLTDPRYPGRPVFGPADVTTAIALDLNPAATTASFTVYLGGSPSGDPVTVTPAPPTTGTGPSGTPPEDQVLRPPVYTKFNTYLRQLNFLELINAGTAAMTVDVFLHNLAGQVITAASVPLQPSTQFDVDINTLVRQGCTANPASCTGFVDLDANGVVDTYGLVRLEFDQTDPNRVLIGRMSQYRLNPDGQTYSFAFARELRNPSQGPSYAVGNTFDPQGQGFLVPNWVEVINLSSTTQAFTYNLYDQSGALAFSGSFSVGPLGERDLQGGHEIVSAGRVVEGVYLIEIIPSDSSANYLMYVSRYSSNSPAGVEPTTYNYAFSLDGRSGTSAELFLPIANETSSFTCSSTTNWVEVVNVSSSTVNANVEFRDAAGAVIQTTPFSFAPKSQFHFNASALLATRAANRGTTVVTPGTPGTIVTQSLIYLHECDRNSLATAYVVPGIRAAGQRITGTINTFLNMSNDLVLIGTKPGPVTATYAWSAFTGATKTEPVNLTAFGTELVNLSGIQGFPPNAYGVISVTAPSQQEVLGFLSRTRIALSGNRTRVDFVMPTRLR